MKYKICPRCGRHNPPTALDCENCDTDITAARVTDEENEKAAGKEPATVQMVRICEACGHANPANARKCQACGEDISDVTPTEESAAGQLHFRLASLDGAYAYEIQPGKTVIGREETMAEYLRDKVYVSRRHAELTLENGKLTVLNLSHSNYTYVNNIRCVAECEELHDGDEIGLGGNSNGGQRQKDAAYFMVRIGSCT